MRGIIKKILLGFLCSILCLSSLIMAGCGNTDESDKHVKDGRYQKVVESDINLVENGQSAYKILLRNEYDSAEAYAAEEFNRLLKEASGVELPVVTEANVDASTKYISIGDTAMSEAAKVKPTIETYKRNGFQVKSYKDGLVINAPQRSGLIYGVYRFFEQNCDYMYYGVDTFKITRSNTIQLKEFDFHDWPDFENRDVYCYGTRSNPAHTMRLFTTGGQFSTWEEKYGEGSWWAKTLDDQSFITALLRPGQYYEENNEWYYRKSKGSGYLYQLCYTEGLYSKDESGITDVSQASGDGTSGMFWTLVYNLINNHILVEQDKSVFLLGMTDSQDYCDCDKCDEDVAKYEKSGVCVRFLNAIAREVEKWRLANCPEREIFLSVFAYQDLTVPPVKRVNGEYVALDESVYVEDNIMIRYAPSYDYYTFPLLDEEHNPGSTEAILGWTMLAKNLAVWDYRECFHDLMCPFPSWLSTYENIQTYKEYGFKDVLHQSLSGWDGMPFLNMDNWIRARLLWNTNEDYDSLLYEFTEAYYGEAGVYVRDYIEYLTNHYNTYLMDLKRYFNPHYPLQITSTYFPRGVINNIENIFNKMYVAIEPYRSTDNDKYELLKAHVDYESAFYRYCQINMYNSFYVKAKLSDMIDEFERIQQQIGFTALTPWTGDFEVMIANWRKNLLVN